MPGPTSHRGPCSRTRRRSRHSHHLATTRRVQRASLPSRATRFAPPHMSRPPPSGYNLSQLTALGDRCQDSGPPARCAGDSIASGYGCDCENFVERYADLTRSTLNRHVTVSNLAFDGATTREDLDALSTHSFAAPISAANVLVVMIGANDMGTSVDRYEADECGGPDNLACFKEQIDVTEADITELLARIHATGTLTTTGTRYSRHLPANVRTCSQLTPNSTRQSARQRSLPMHFASTRHRCSKGPMAPAIRLRTFSKTGDHPNAIGHELLAEFLADARYAPVA